MEEYEVVYTKSDKAVLDIGLKDEDGVIARWSDHDYYCKHTPRYENAKANKWHHSGIFMSKRRWEKISLNTGTDEICNILGIPYYIKKKEKKNYMKQVLDTYRRLRRKDG